MPNKKRFIFGLLLLGVLPLCGILHPYLIASPTTVCLFKAVTGRPCCFCGLTRSFACAMHADFTNAYGYHFFWMPIMAIWVAIGMTCLWDGWSGGNRLEWWRTLAAKTGWFLVGGILVGTLFRAMI